MRAPPVVRGGTAVRWTSLVVGLFLFAAGIVAILESKLGLSPWDVLNQGVSRHTPLSFGQANIAIAVVVLLIGLTLRAPIGAGTVANAILIGVFVDRLLAIGWVDGLSGQALGVRIVLLFGGIAVIGLGSGFYIGASLGAGPRDSLMLVLSRAVALPDRGRQGGARGPRSAYRLRARRHGRARHARLRGADRPCGRGLVLAARAPRARRPVGPEGRPRRRARVLVRVTTDSADPCAHEH